MKYIKEYYASQKGGKFHCNDWVVPIASSLKLSLDRAYQITGESAPYVSPNVPEWTYHVENPDYEWDTRNYRESELRNATWQEVEEEKLKRDAKKYNL